MGRIGDFRFEMFLFCLCCVILGCSNREQSDLDRLNIKGDAISLEIATQTTIPISEWLYTDVSVPDLQRYIRNDAVYSFCGQSKLLFDKLGNLSKLIVYNNLGNQIYESPELTRPITLYNPININVNELPEKWTFENDSVGRIIRQNFSHNGELLFERNISYNNDGDIDMVVCNYHNLKINAFDESIIPSDTTFFKYTQFDNNENWTEAAIAKHGRLKTDSYELRVRRQITYSGQNRQKELCLDLQNWNKEVIKEEKYNANLQPTSFFNGKILLGLPQKMKIEDSLSGNGKLKVYKLDTDKGFFSISVFSGEQDGSVYDFTDEQANESMTYALAQNGIIILSWIGSSIMNINGKQFAEFNYSHYASGGTLSTGDPIIVKILSFQEEGSTNCTSISFGYDSNHENLYKPLMKKIISTIKIK